MSAPLRVWAPRARRVEVVLGEERIELVADALSAGWHELRDRTLAPGADYALSLDGGEPLPDPRSGWQPHGVRGPSRVVDHVGFEWSQPEWDPGEHWLRRRVVYEIHVGTFSAEGTFDGAIDHLDALVDLGVGAVELMPVAEFPGSRGWGYDGVDLWAPHSAYGGPEGLKRLVDACHARGLAVLLDVVYNHLGPSGNNLAEFGPYFTDRYETPWGDAVNLDGDDSGEVREFFIENALMWVRDYRFDGLRLDAVHALFDRSRRHFLQELAERVHGLGAELGRHVAVVAESNVNDRRLVRDPSRGGYGLDAQWYDDFHHALHALLTGERDGYYADYGSLGRLAWAIGDGEPGHRYVGFLQNHDQIGNRARGERSAHLLSPGRLRGAAAMVLLSPYVPMLFQGEEWGASAPFQYFTDHHDRALADQVRDGRRREFAGFGWQPDEVPDPQDHATFARSRLDWSERDREPHATILEWHRELIALRATIDQDAPVRCTHDDATGAFVMDRGTVRVVMNLGSRPLTIEDVEVAPDDVAVLRVTGAVPG